VELSWLSRLAHKRAISIPSRSDARSEIRTATCGPRISVAAKAYIGLTALCGLAGLGYGFLSAGYPQSIEVLLIVVLLGGLAQATWVPLFSGSGVSIASAASFVALLLLGPLGAILSNLGSAAVHAVYPTRRPWYKMVFNASVLTVSAASAGAAYSLTGGVWPLRDVASAAVPTVAAALVYFAINTTAVALAVSLTTGNSFVAIFNDDHWWLILHHLTVAAISLMAAFGYYSMGWPGLAAFSLPLVMPWISTRMYVAQTKTVIARNAELTGLNARLAEANASLQHHVGEMAALYRTGLALNQTLELHDVLAHIVSSVRDLTQANGVAIFLNDGENGRLRLANQVGMGDAYLSQPELSLDGPALRAIGERRRLILDGYPANRDLLSANAAIEGVVAAACLPLAIGDKVVGALDIIFKEPHVFSVNELTLIETFAEQAAAGIHNAQLYQQVHNAYLSAIAALVATVEAKDPYTRGHSERVRDLAISIGIKMGLLPEELNTLELAALFHDIGKIGIPENVLGKTGPLAEEEWDLIKRHPTLAENILKHLPALAETIPIIRAHHERPDGKGYPDGLHGEIPLLSAIIAVADSYDAMMSNRPYRKALPKDRAIAELKAGAGSQFNAEVVESFIRVIQPEAEAKPQPVIPEIRFRRDGVPATVHMLKASARKELTPDQASV